MELLVEDLQLCVSDTLSDSFGVEWLYQVDTKKCKSSIDDLEMGKVLQLSHKAGQLVGDVRIGREKSIDMLIVV